MNSTDTNSPEAQADAMQRLKVHIFSQLPELVHPAAGILKYPYLTNSVSCYAHSLWDWDCWFVNMAFRQAVKWDSGLVRQEVLEEAEDGCLRNFLDHVTPGGWMPICLHPDMDASVIPPAEPQRSNSHKPTFFQHLESLIAERGGRLPAWLPDSWSAAEAYLGHYLLNQFDAGSGLHFWCDDTAIGIDNDPAAYFRPDRSTASFFLNAFLLREFEAAARIAGMLGKDASLYRKHSGELREAIQKLCWDEWTGYFYSLDINLLPLDTGKFFLCDGGDPVKLHTGAPRNWSGLPMRILGWSGMLALWAGVATPDQAERIVHTHLRNGNTLGCEYGIRTLSRLEPMYQIRASGNPSCWLGPVWIISNYLTFSGLLSYGFQEDAEQLARRTIDLLSRDLGANGAFHEYYHPDTGAPVMNKGFQDWNFLVLLMIAWLEGRKEY